MDAFRKLCVKQTSPGGMRCPCCRYSHGDKRRGRKLARTQLKARDRQEVWQ